MRTPRQPDRPSCCSTCSTLAALCCSGSFIGFFSSAVYASISYTVRLPSSVSASAGTFPAGESHLIVPLSVPWLRPGHSMQLQA